MPGLSSYDIVGKKEDVSDIITNISPTKTPFQTLIGKDSVHNTYFQWQEDSLRAAAQNAQVDGFTANPIARTPTAMRSNYTQILQDTFQVAGTTDAVSTYGRAKESAYQAAKSMAQLKRDLEYILVGVWTAAVAGDQVTARKMASYAKQLNASSGSSTAGTQWTKTGNTNTKMSEQNVLDILNVLYTAGAEPSVLMVSPTNALTVANFVGTSGANRTRMLDGETTKIVNAVDVYTTPYGSVKTVLNRFSNTSPVSTFIFDPAMWSLVTLRPWFRETLAKTGDNLSQMIVGEFSLKHKNYAASGLITEEA